MSKVNRLNDDDLRSEYDFASMKGGVRGKYVARLRKGSNLVLLEPEIAAAFRTLLDERLGVAVAEIRTARPLDEAEKQELAGALRVRTGRDVRMKYALDPAVIGGAVARVGGTIYDGSVQGQLERLRVGLLSG